MSWPIKICGTDHYGWSCLLHPRQEKDGKQVMDWLKPGGQFIMTHIPPNTPITKGQDPMRELSCF